MAVFSMNNPKHVCDLYTGFIRGGRIRSFYWRVVKELRRGKTHKYYEPLRLRTYRLRLYK